MLKCSENCLFFESLRELTCETVWILCLIFLERKELFSFLFFSFSHSPLQRHWGIINKWKLPFFFTVHVMFCYLRAVWNGHHIASLQRVHGKSRHCWSTLENIDFWVRIGNYVFLEKSSVSSKFTASFAESSKAPWLFFSLVGPECPPLSAWIRPPT